MDMIEPGRVAIAPFLPAGVPVAVEPAVVVAAELADLLAEGAGVAAGANCS